MNSCATQLGAARWALGEPLDVPSGSSLELAEPDLPRLWLHDDLPACMPLLDVSDGVWYGAQGVVAVDDWGQLFPREKLSEKGQVLLGRLGDRRTELLAPENGKERAPNQALAHLRPVTTCHQVHAVGREGATVIPDRAESVDREDHVIMFPALGEVLPLVVDDAVGTQRACDVHLAGTAHGGDLRAQHLGDLHGESADAARCAEDEHLVA